MLSTNCTSHNMFKVTIPSTFILREISRLLYQFFIDNITLILKDDSAIISIVQELQQYFKLYDLDPTSFLLLVQVKQDLEAHTILLSQSYYINELLKHFGINDCNPVKTPLFSETDMSGLVPIPSEQTEMKLVPYLSAVGSL